MVKLGKILSKKLEKKGLMKLEGCIILIINNFQHSILCPLFFNFSPIYRDFLRKSKKKKKGKRN